MNTYYSGRSSRPAELFSFGLLDGLQVRLRRPHLREAYGKRRVLARRGGRVNWGFSLSRFPTAFMNNPG